MSSRTRYRRRVGARTGVGRALSRSLPATERAHAKGRLGSLPKVTLNMLVLSVVVEGFLRTFGVRSIDAVVDSPFNLSNVVRGILLGMAVAVATMVCFRYLRASLRILRAPHNLAVVLFGIWCAISAVVSEAPELTLLASIFLIGGIVSMLSLPTYAVARTRGPDLNNYLRVLLAVLTRWLALLLALVWLGTITGILSGRIAEGPAWSPGLLPFRLYGDSWFWWSANTVADVSAVLFLISVVHLEWGSRRTKHMSLAVLALSSLVFAETRSALLALGLVLFMHLWRRRRFVTLIGTCLAGLMLFSSPVGKAYVLRGQTLEQFQGATGRVALWSVASRDIAKRPLVGYGYYSGTRLALGSKWFAATGEHRSNMDNAYLQVAYDTGVVGLALFVLVLVLAGWQLYASRAPNPPSAFRLDPVMVAFAGLVLVYFAIRGTFGPTFQNLGLPFIAVGLAMTVATISYLGDARVSEPLGSGPTGLPHLRS